MAPRLQVLAAFDKFRGTASAAQLGAAVSDVGWERAWDVTELPLADGGEGTLDVLARGGGSHRRTTVHDALGRSVEAEFLVRGRNAYVEMARASGLAQVGGADGNDPLQASTRGTGELLRAALDAGVKRIVVTLGGSATTDGGKGAIDAMRPLARFRAVDLVVACDVETTFVDAARVFGPQKGASPAQVELLTRRLESLAGTYLEEFGVDVRSVPGSGAAGGLAGGLVAIGATLQSGFDLVADELGLAEQVTASDVVITGEGFLDEESFNGKVVGGVVALAAAASKPVVVLCGGRSSTLRELPARAVGTVADVIVLSHRFGKERSWADPVGCVREALSNLPLPDPGLSQ